MTPEQRRARARRAANASWENTNDKAARTAKAREAAAARFERQARELHPDASDEHIARVAKQLKDDFYERIQLSSARKRRAAAEAKATASAA